MATKIEGLDKLKAKLARIPVETKREIKAALEKSADELVAMQGRLVPVDTGDLSDSIQSKPGRHDLAVEVSAGGGDAFYGHFVEFGTVNTPAQPFFFPAYRALRRRIRGRITRATKKAAKTVAGNGQ